MSDRRQDNAPFTLPGVSAAYLLERYGKARGREIESGKLSSPVSSSCLAANCFSWFTNQPAELPPFPGMKDFGVPTSVDVEVQMRCPWRGGVHSWLDAVVETETHIIGVESKRYEPFRDAKVIDFSSAYDRDIWVEGMSAYQLLRDQLRSGYLKNDHLDAAQLVKHSLGLSTQAAKVGKKVALVYLFAEPAELHGKPIAAAEFARHREEASRFSALVEGALVTFGWSSYRDWIATWPTAGPVGDHGRAVLEAFHP